jgi:hypothetical protein
MVCGYLQKSSSPSVEHERYGFPCVNDSLYSFYKRIEKGAIGQSAHRWWSSATPFLISVVSAVKAMRLYTDGKCALMAQTMDIEIGGALTDDTPPELSAEAS